MPRVSVRHACLENAGMISFFRRTVNNQSRFRHAPCICIHDLSGWKWIAFDKLDAANFVLYQDTITRCIKYMQRDRRSMYSDIDVEPQLIYLPSPMERALLEQIFNHHLTDREKKRYIYEFSNTIIAKRNCSGCLGVVIDKKRKCLHYKCPGMCENCYEGMGDECPICKKPQVATCPICKEEKPSIELCHHANNKHFARCGHPVCWECMGKAYVSGRPLVKCPLCRVSWVQHRVAGDPVV